MEKLAKALLVLLFLFTISPTQAATALDKTGKPQACDWNKVMDAIIHVESGGDPNAKSGNSVGVMQITPILVAECNNILRSRKSKKRFKLSDRWSIKKSKEMFLLFQSKYNPSNSIEYAIRSWNGGIRYKVRNTQRYFEKVMSAMK